MNISQCLMKSSRWQIHVSFMSLLALLTLAIARTIDRFCAVAARLLRCGASNLLLLLLLLQLQLWRHGHLQHEKQPARVYGATQWQEGGGGGGGEAWTSSAAAWSLRWRREVSTGALTECRMCPSAAQLCSACVRVRVCVSGARLTPSDRTYRTCTPLHTHRWTQAQHTSAAAITPNITPPQLSRSANYNL